MIRLSRVKKAIDAEQLTGVCTPELFRLACADIESFIAYSAQIVWATKTSIGERLGITPQCPCCEPTCTGHLSPGCGMTHALQAAAIVEQAENDDEIH
jgi:hypothetical protein